MFAVVSATGYKLLHVNHALFLREIKAPDIGDWFKAFWACIHGIALCTNAAYHVPARINHMITLVVALLPHLAVRLARCAPSLFRFTELDNLLHYGVGNRRAHAGLMCFTCLQRRKYITIFATHTTGMYQY